jgi:hypothetical protein
LLQQGDSEKTSLSEAAQLALNASFDHLDFTQSVMERDAIALDEQHTRGLKPFAQKTSKRFSHAKTKRKSIDMWMIMVQLARHLHWVYRCRYWN